MSAVVGYAPDGSDAWLVFQMRPGSYNEESLIEFLTELHGHLNGDKVTIIWDGLPSHRSKAMKAFVASQRSWLVVERLPGYAHDLNPVEMIWGNLKSQRAGQPLPRHHRGGCRASPTPGSSGSAAMPSSASPSSGTRVFLCDRTVTVLCEPL